MFSSVPRAHYLASSAVGERTCKLQSFDLQGSPLSGVVKLIKFEVCSHNMFSNDADAPSLPQSRTNLIVKELAGEVLVYDETSTKAYCLNKSAATIWSMCDGKTSMSEMARKAAVEFDGMIDEAFVAVALASFRDNGLLENESADIRPIARLTRAELVARVGRVGLAATVALPLVTSIVAPTAAKAYGRSSGETGRGGNTNPIDTDDRSPVSQIKRSRREKSHGEYHTESETAIKPVVTNDHASQNSTVN